MASHRPAASLLLCAVLGGCMLPPPPLPPAALPVAVVPQPEPDALGRLAAMPDVAPPASEAVSVAGDAVPVTRLVMGERVLFDSGSDQPLPGASSVLALVAEAARQAGPGTAVTVLGHTDDVGGDAYNIGLSQRRAAAVIAALRALGLDPAGLAGVAVGRRQPIASNATAEGRAENRRVEFLLSPSLAANLAAVTARAGEGDVAVLQPGPGTGLRVAGTVRLGPGERAAAPVGRTAAPRVVRAAQPSQPTLRLNAPDPVRLAPLGPSVTY